MWKLLAAPFKLLGLLGSAADAAEFSLDAMLRTARRSAEESDKESLLKHQVRMKDALLRAANQCAQEREKLLDDIEKLSPKAQEQFLKIESELQAFWQEYEAKSNRNATSEQE